MPAPNNFTWIERPLLAAMARPDGSEELRWLRQQGIELLLTLSEDSVRRDWVNEAGLLALHVPIIDMDAPTQDQIDTCVSAIRRAHGRNMGVAVHCTAGLGRTGTILATYFVSQGDSAREAIARVRSLRPGSVETDEQVESIEQYSRRLGEQG
jgi:atypical dual specificity phosphatase